MNPVGRLSQGGGSLNNMLTMGVLAYLARGNSSDNLLTTGLMLIVLNYVVTKVLSLINFTYDYGKRKMFFSVTIKSDDDIYSWILEWLSKQKYTEKYGDLGVYSDWGRKKRRDYSRPHVYETDSRAKKRPELCYIPSYGSHLLFHKKHLLWISRYKIQNNTLTQQHPFHYNNVGSTNQFKNEEIKISTVGRKGGDFLKNLVVDIMEENIKKTEGKTWIYTSYRGGSWKRSSTKKIRTLESVILPNGTKDKILEDLTSFLESEKWYNETGVPFRRGYLLFGRPGTGKTSFIMALAGKLKMSIAILSINASTMNDFQLQLLLDSSPSDTIIIIEDIDSCIADKDLNKTRNVNPWGGGIGGGVTFSGLTNALDGAGSKEGRIIFLTSNHPEKLSPTLIRPGRVDIKQEFKYAAGGQIQDLFLKFYPDEEDTAKKLREMIKEFHVVSLVLSYRDFIYCIEKRLGKFWKMLIGF